MEANLIEDDLVEDNMTLYEEQKALGERRENGALNLKSLKPIHLKIISMHLEGIKNSVIALELGRTDATISRILSDPLVVAKLDEAFKAEQSRLRSLTGKAVDAVDSALDHDNVGVQLRGVDRYVKLSEKLGDGQGIQKETAEDFAKKILDGINLQVNVQVNNEG